MYIIIFIYSVCLSFYLFCLFYRQFTSLFTTHFCVLVFAILTINEVIAQRLPGNAAPLWTRKVIPTEISTIKVSSVICERREICWNKNRTTDKQFIVVQFDIFRESCRLSYRSVMFSRKFDNDRNVYAPYLPAHLKNVWCVVELIRSLNHKKTELNEY